MHSLKLVSILLVLAVTFACQSPSSSSPTLPTVAASVTVTAASSSTFTVSNALKAASAQNTQLSLTVPLGTTAQDLYFVFTNESSVVGTLGMPAVVGDQVDSTKSAVTASTTENITVGERLNPTTAPTRIQEANRAVAQGWKAASASASRSSTTVSADSSSSSGSTIGSTTSKYIIPSSEASSYTVGTNCSYDSSTKNAYIPCTLRYASPSVSGRKLYVWVADNVWNSNSTSQTQAAASTSGLYTTGASIPFKVDYYMVNQMAAKFLSNGTTDIYGCDTAILGKEYYDTGASPASGLITPQGEIHIYIIDLNPAITSSSKGMGGILGYFYGADNFTSSVYSDSNQKIMFQLDAEMLANPTSNGSQTNAISATWTLAGSYWPNELVSTLAHEFQHMIHFYQKQVLHSLSSDTDTWINEMCSMVTEDIVANKLGTLGPRGNQFKYSDSSFSYNNAAGSRYQSPSNRTNTYYNDPSARQAFFNCYYPVMSLESWNNNISLVNYGMAYSFGSWLIRNFGGPQLLNKIVTSSSTGENAVVDAVNTLNGTGYTMTQLIETWAAAELLKTYATTAPYQLIGPSDTFSPSAINNNGNSVSFTYGSINPATYYPFDYYGNFVSAGYLINNGGGPLVFTNTVGVVAIPARAFYYYSPSGSSGLTGTKTYSVYVPANVNLQVVTVPH